MHRTIFDTPIVATLIRGFSIVVLRCTGWKLENTLSPHIKKCVIIAAPHTSNWDMPIMLMIAFKLHLPVHWVGKKSIFRFPFGGLMRWLGGISVDREKQTGTVGVIAEAISDSDKSFYLIISPEGTRKKVRKWKTGYYHIAMRASVPIVCAYMDYARKRGGIGMTLTPTGAFSTDMKVINYFYRPIEGKNPEQFSTHVDTSSV